MTGNKSGFWLVFTVFLTLALSLSSAAAEGGLKINFVNIQVTEYEPTRAYNIGDLRDYHGGVSNNATIGADVYPGAKLEFEIEVENTFKSAADEDNDTAIKDVFATINIQEIDDDADIEKESTDVDLDPTDAGKIYAYFEIPKKVQANTYKVTLDLQGDGSDGSSYGEFWGLKLPIKKVSHDIRIESFGFDKTSATCGDSVIATVNLYNAGREQESDIQVGIKNDKLGVNVLSSKLSLSNDVESDGSESEQKLSFNIPKNAANSDYTFTANIYWKGIVFYTKNYNLKVSGCEGTSNVTTIPAPTTTVPETDTVKTEPEQTDEPVPVIVGTEETPKTTETETETAGQETSEPIASSRESPLRNSKLYIPLLSGIIFIAILVVAGIFIFLGKGKKTN